MSDIDKINAALKAVNGIQTTIFDLMQNLLRVPQFSTDYTDESDSFIKKVQQLLQQLQDRKTDLDTTAKLISSPQVSIRDNIGYTATLALDPNYEKSTLTTNQILTYRYLGNIQEYSQLACQAITSKLLKKNFFQRQRHMKAQQIPNNHLIAPQKVEAFINNLERMHNIRFDISKPFGAFLLVKTTLDRAMKVVMILRGYIIEWVQIKGIDESFEDPSTISLNKFEKRYLYLHNPDSKMDLWTPSRYEIFRMITQHANSAILHFYAPSQMDTAIKAYVGWLRSYSSADTPMFMVQCKKCESRLLNGMPPTWRDFRSNEPFHFECRP